MGARRLLPWIDDAGERLRLALGAALSFKMSGQSNVVIAYVRRDSLSERDWRRVLSLGIGVGTASDFCGAAFASAARRQRTAANLSDDARRWGVPGIPVDAGDAVALYRVAQESLGRIRGGDGPVLIECLQLRLRAKIALMPPIPLFNWETFCCAGRSAQMSGCGTQGRDRSSAD